MMSVLCSGTLVSDPKSRTSANGKPYATCTMRTPVDGDEAVLISCIAFDAAAVQSMLALQKGDSLAVTGRAKLSTWEKNGEQHTGLSIVVERVMSAYMLNKKRQAAREPEGIAA